MEYFCLAEEGRYTAARVALPAMRLASSNSALLPNHIGSSRASGKNWQDFAEACPRDMAILRQVLQDYAEAVPYKQLLLA